MQKHSMTSHQMDTRLSLKPQLFTALIFHYAVATLLLTHRGRSQQIGQPQPLVAVVGDDITLPCHVKTAKDAVSVMVEWSRPDLQPRFVHMRRSGEDRLVDQNPSYRGRTSVSIDGLEQGDLSLTLFNVKPSDEGTYRCFAPDLDTDSRIQLVVDVIKISKVSTGVLECKYTGQYPDPEMFWLDGEGHVLSAGPTETVRGPDGLYTVSSRVTVEKGHRNNFTCRVQEKSTGQSKETHVYVPDDFFTDSSSSSAPAVIGVFVAIMLILAAVFGVWKWRHKCKAWSYNTDEEKGGNHNKNSISTESELESLMKGGTDGEKPPAKTEAIKNETKVEEENNIESSKEETGLSREIEKETQQTQTTNNESAGKNPTDEGIKTMNNMDNSKATKTVSEETQTPDPSDPDSSQDKPKKNTEEGTESINDGTKGQDTIDGGQQKDTVGSGVNTDLNKDGNKEQGGQENQPLVKDNKVTANPPEGTGQQEKDRDDKDGGGDTTPTEHTHNTTSESTETEVQSPDKNDEDKTKNPANNTPGNQSSTDKGIPKNGLQAGGGTNNDLKRPEEPGEEPQDIHKTGNGKQTEEENNSVSNQTGTPSSANTGTSTKQTEEQTTAEKDIQQKTSTNSQTDDQTDGSDDTMSNTAASVSREETSV